MVQLPAVVRTRSSASASGGGRSAAGPDRSSRLRSLVGTIGTVLAITGVAYLVSRWLRSDDGGIGLEADTESVREVAAEIAPGEGRSIPIGEPGAEEPEREDVDADAEGGARDGTEADLEADETEDEGSELDPEESSLGADRSPEELEELGETDVQEEPAEPGEMTVDEDVVDEVVDEEGEDEAAGDETD